MREAAEEIHLRLPGRSEYARLVRVGAASLGFRVGLTFAEIDALRAATDAAVAFVLDQSSREGPLDVYFRVADDTVELDLRGAGSGPADDVAYARFVSEVAALVDGYELTPDGHLVVHKTATD